MLQPYHCLAVSVMTTSLTIQSIHSFQSYRYTTPIHPDPVKRYGLTLPPKPTPPCMMTTSQSIQRTPLRTASRVAPAPQRSLSAGIDPLVPTPYTGPVCLRMDWEEGCGDLEGGLSWRLLPQRLSVLVWYCA
jgi:hypothetical protein